MLRKLQIKFVIINMAMVTAMLCVIFCLVFSFTRSHLETESINMMRSIAADPFQLGHPNEQSQELKLPYFTIQLGLNGELISTGGGYYDLSDRDFLSHLINESVESHKETGIIPEHDLRFCRVTTPMGTVLVFSDMSSENSILAGLVKSSVIIGTFSFLLFLGISIFLSRWAVKPVQYAWQRQKQFVADASHELKTPLTVIITNAEMLESGSYSVGQQREFSKTICEMSRQMHLLIEDLLVLARADAELPKQSMQPVDLSALMLNTAISFEGVFADRGLSLETVIDPGIQVSGCGPELEQVAGILLDNAAKYSDPEGTTVILLHTTGRNRCRLSVSDPGAVIPPEELEKIFLRFYRMDKSRSRDGSFGLGLSIAQSIVSRHGGKIWAESHDGSNTFNVELNVV